MGTLVIPTITERGKERELKLLLPAGLLAGLGLEHDEPMTVEIVDDKLVLRRATVVEQTTGALAQYGKSPAPTIGELKSAFAEAIAEENASHE